MSIKSPGIVVLTIAYHSHKALKTLANDLALQEEHPKKWIVVNNSPSSAGEIDLEIPFPFSVIVGDEGSGFSSGCNRGLDLLMRIGWDGWVWLLNPDIRLGDSSIIKRLRLFIESLPLTSLVGTAVINPEGNLEKSAGWIDSGLNFRRRKVNQTLINSNQQEPISVDWVSGCSMLIRPLSHFKKARFEASLPLYYEDMDFCLRLSKESSPVIWLPFISVIHSRGEGSQTSSTRRIRLSTCSYIRFLQRHRPGMVLFLRTLRILANSLLRLPLTPLRSFAVLQGCVDAYLNPLA